MAGGGSGGIGVDERLDPNAKTARKATAATKESATIRAFKGSGVRAGSGVSAVSGVFFFVVVGVTATPRQGTSAAIGRGAVHRARALSWWRSMISVLYRLHEGRCDRPNP